MLEAQQLSIERNPDLKRRGYNIDQGGVRARTVIKRLMGADAPGTAPSIAGKLSAGVRSATHAVAEAFE